MLNVKEELVTLEKQFWQAMVDRDIDAALKLTNDPCIVAGQGVSRISKEKFGEMMKTGDWTLHKFELRDVEVKQLTDDVAIIGYKVREELTVGGEPVVMEAADASTWSARTATGCARCTPRPCPVIPTVGIAKTATPRS